MVEPLSTGVSEARSPSSELAAEVAGLYQLHAAELLRYASTLLCSQDTARDAVQEIFLRYFVERRYGRRIENPRAWLYQVLRNYGRDHLNTLAVKAQTSSEGVELLPSRGHDPEQILRRTEITREMESALTARESDCVRLRIQGMSYAEIGKVLGIRSGTVGALLARAHRKILDAVGS
jgi:RNA polymerase sigma-70 factor (ECF subfamily)